ncbi:MAG: TonB-dependent receptor, partial [Phenylobacterium sp.]|nr:TonB-dependent receptor [Phenylobacterium sp.]
ALLALGIAASAVAQETAQLEEVVVTARKRQESIQDVPVAVSAFSGRQLEQRGVRIVSDLARTVPSLKVNNQSQGSAQAVTFALRGQSASDIISTIDQAIGIYVDGAYIPRPYGLQAGVVDLQSVEVLTGPQGTLYGRNTTGGAINIISRGADYAGVHGYVYGELGDYKDKRLTAAVNVPIIADTLTVRGAYQIWKREGYGSSRITGQDLAKRNQQFFRGSVRWDPTPRARIELKGDWTRIRENGLLTTARSYQPQAATNYQAAVELGLDPTVPANLITAQNVIQQVVAQGNKDIFTSDSEIISREDLNSYSFVLTGSFDLTDHVQLKSISSYRHLDDTHDMDLDATRFHLLELVTFVPNTLPGSFPLPTRPMVSNRIWTQEFNLAGTTWDNRLKFLFGAFYSDELGSDATQNDFRANVNLLTAVPATLRPFTINFNEGIDIGNISYALYTQNDYQITSKLSVTGGLRYTWEERSMLSALRRFDPVSNLYRCGYPGLNGLITTDPNVCSVRLPNDKESGASYLASINYKPTVDSLVYLRTARGFRGGGYQLRAPTAPNFAPEFATDWELGAKADFFQHRLRTNVAFYKTDYKNKQESSIVPVPIQGNATIITNAANAKIKGFEAEITARPIEALTLQASTSYIHGKYQTYLGALSYTGAPFGDASGETFAYPPWQYSLSGRYVLPVGPGDVGLEADWSWTSGARPSARLLDPSVPASVVDSLVSNGPGGRASLGLLNLRADYDLRSAGLTFSVFVSNATDRHYQVPGIAGPNVGGVTQGITQEPRMWGVGVRKSFGAE